MAIDSGNGNNVNAFVNLAKVERLLENWANYVKDGPAEKGKHLGFKQTNIIAHLMKFGTLANSKGQYIAPENSEAMKIEEILRELRVCFPNLYQVIEIEYLKAPIECWDKNQKARCAGISVTKYYKLLFASQTWLHGVLFANKIK